MLDCGKSVIFGAFGQVRRLKAWKDRNSEMVEVNETANWPRCGCVYLRPELCVSRALVEVTSPMPS